MRSKQSLEANRANAKRSTGPKTSAGKERSRTNAWKHGLTARFLLRGEDAAEFERLRKQLLQDYNPQSALGVEAVEDIARTLVLKKRAAFFEAAILEARFKEVQLRRGHDQMMESLATPYLSNNEEDEEEEAPDTSPEAKWRLELGKALLSDSTDGDLLGKVDRHRAMLTSDLMKMVKLLLLVEATHAPEPEGALLIEDKHADDKN